ncbi:MAG: Com family DNA-binding transcriptional regulator [Blautia sp.]|nr:Com family DNA-binding transcriptional regulator [Clostridiales bacterium]DAG85360.1 MAG TPA: cysteine-rich protein [Caudoviricetes sp.]
MKCRNCGRTLLLAKVLEGEMKCPRCGKINRIIFRQGQEPISRTKE